MSEHWDEGDAVSILFEGSKYFGTTQTLFHIAVIEHDRQDIIEIVSYNKRHAVEAPRLYLTYSAVLSRIDASAVSERVQSLREEATERQIAVDEKKFVKIATGEILFDFLSSRLFAVAVSVQKVTLEFKLLHKDPKSASAPNPLCSRPEHVEPFSFDSVSASEGKGLSAKQKWRIPIVLAKVAKGRPLNRRDSKIWNACDTLFADGDIDTLGSARFSTASMTNSDVGSLGGTSTKSQRWNTIQHHFAASSNSAPAVEQDNPLQQQPKARRNSSFSAGYEAILSSLQLGLSIVSGTSIKATKVAAGSADRGGEVTVGSLAMSYSAGSVGSAGSEESRKGGWRRSQHARGGTMMSRAASRNRTGAASPKPAAGGNTPTHSAELSDAVLDPEEEEEISLCERANRELRAARYIAKLAANAASAAASAANASPVSPPQHAGASAPSLPSVPSVVALEPSSIWVENSGEAALKTGLKSEKAQSPSMKFKPSSDSAKSTMSALLHPMLRLIDAVTRRSIPSAVAAEG